MGAPENVSVNPPTRPKPVDRVLWQETAWRRTTRGQERRSGRGTNDRIGEALVKNFKIAAIVSGGTNDRIGAALAKNLKIAAIVTSEKVSTTMKNWMTAAAVAGMHLRQPAGRNVSTDEKQVTKERAEAEAGKLIPPAEKRMTKERAKAEAGKLIPPATAVTTFTPETLGPWETLENILEAIYDAIYDATLCVCPCLKNGPEWKDVGSSCYDGSSYDSAWSSMNLNCDDACFIVET